MRMLLALLLLALNAHAVTQLGDGLSADRTKFVNRIANKCPANGNLGSVYCPSREAPTWIIRYKIPKCAVTFFESADNLIWVEVAKMAAKDAADFAVCTPCATSTYSPWGACVNGTQQRTVVARTPAGCGTRTADVLEQTCVATPPPSPPAGPISPAAKYPAELAKFIAASPTKCPTPPVAGVCKVGTQTGVVTFKTAPCTAALQVAGNMQWVLSADLKPFVCAPPPPPACSSWACSAWNTCTASGLQACSAVSGSPSGCAGTAPTIQPRPCTPPPPPPSQYELCMNNSTETYTICDSISCRVVVKWVDAVTLAKRCEPLKGK